MEYSLVLCITACEGEKASVEFVTGSVCLLYVNTLLRLDINFLTLTVLAYCINSHGS